MRKDLVFAMQKIREHFSIEQGESKSREGVKLPSFWFLSWTNSAFLLSEMPPKATLLLWGTRQFFRTETTETLNFLEYPLYLLLLTRQVFVKHYYFFKYEERSRSLLRPGGLGLSNISGTLVLDFSLGKNQSTIHVY